MISQSAFSNDSIKLCNYRLLPIIMRRKQMHNINSEIFFSFLQEYIPSSRRIQNQRLPILSTSPSSLSHPSLPVCFFFHLSLLLSLYLSELENTLRINKWQTRFTRPTSNRPSMKGLTSGNGRCVSISVIDSTQYRQKLDQKSYSPRIDPVDCRADESCPITS